MFSIVQFFPSTSSGSPPPSLLPFDCYISLPCRELDGDLLEALEALESGGPESGSGKKRDDEEKEKQEES